MKMNRITKSIRPFSVFDDCRNQIDATITFEQGDLLYLDTGLIRKQKVGDTGLNFLGIADQSVTLGKVNPPYTTDDSAAEAIASVVGPKSGVVAKLVSKTGDAWLVGAKVYPDPATGTNGVSSTAGALIAIGIYQGPAIVAAAAGQEIEVLIGETYSAGAMNI